jgi:ribosome-binding factor A
MSRESKRTEERVTEMIQRKLSQLIQQEIKDPRLSTFVTISSVKLSADLTHAKVYFTVFNQDIAQTTSLLNAATSYLRTALARSIKLRTVPQLHFVYDKSIEYGRRLSRLIDEANPPDKNDE